MTDIIKREPRKQHTNNEEKKLLEREKAPGLDRFGKFRLQETITLDVSAMFASFVFRFCIIMHGTPLTMTLLIHYNASCMFLDASYCCLTLLSRHRDTFTLYKLYVYSFHAYCISSCRHGS